MRTFHVVLGAFALVPSVTGAVWAPFVGPRLSPEVAQAVRQGRADRAYRGP